METGISVACEVTTGTFISEYFVKIRMFNEEDWTGAVDREIVFDLETEPTEEKYINGRMYAYLISFNENSAAIELPIEDSTIGRRIIVSRKLVRKERIPA